MEIDDHADTTELVSNFLPIHYFERLVDVYGWYVRDGSVECPTISREIAYDYPISGQVYMLVYNQFICCKVLANNLMCPIHNCMEEVNINELPIFLVEDTDENTHSIIVSDPLNPNQPLIITLVLKVVTKYFPYRKPRAS